MKKYFNYWGKSKKDDQDKITFHPLAYHSLDVAAVGQILLQKHPIWQQYFSKCLQLPLEQLLSLFNFLLALHDLGKFSYKFQSQQPTYHYYKFYVKLGEGELSLTKADVMHHTYISKQFIRENAIMDLLHELLGNTSRNSKNIFKDLLETSLYHHGKSIGLASEKKFYSSYDIDATSEFIHDCYQLFKPVMPIDVAKHIFKTNSWMLAGFIVLCDWLGSQDQERLFTYYPDVTNLISLSEYWDKIALPRAEQAVQAAGILSVPVDKNYLSPDTIWPKLKNLRPLQAYCAETKLSAKPQLWLIEDLTGSGKTEAALILAYRLMHAEYVHGLYFGLPTMATANAIYTRLVGFFDKVFNENKPNLILAHSLNKLNDLFQQSVMPQYNIADIQELVDSTANIYCSKWLAESNKRALLAQIGVGTIDQLLQGVLPIKHQSLRLLGCFGKLVIIDEVHAYDAYTNKLLEEFLRYHATLGGSAILMSATLSAQQREGLLNSFEDGLNGQDEKKVEYEEAKISPYPVISMTTYQNNNENRHIQPISAAEPRQLMIKTLSSKEAVFTLLKESRDQKKCVCWIRNTVNEAIETYQVLLNEPWVDPNKLRLIHARFASIDRNTWETKLINDFGAESDNEIRVGQIIISTQVVEQSLDVDFDVMISDLAPIDLLIQRAGRLQRHKRNTDGKVNNNINKDIRTPAIFYVLGPPALENVNEKWPAPLLNKIGKIYPDNGILWRTMLLCESQAEWHFPEQVRSLMESVYHRDSNLALPEALQDKHYESEEGRYYALTGSAKNDVLRLDNHYVESGFNEHWSRRVNSRLIEMETRAVYLLRVTEHGLEPWAKAICNFPMNDRQLWENSKVNLPKYVIDKMLAQPISGTEHFAKMYSYLEEEILLPLKYDEAYKLYLYTRNGDKSNYKISYSSLLGCKFL